MKRSAMLIGLASAAILAGCQTNPSGPPGPPPPPVAGGESFSDQDFAWSTQGGSGSIEGVLTYGGGAGHVTCQDVVLIPRTAWSRRRMIILYGSDSQAAVSAAEVRTRTPTAPSGNYSQYVKHSTCDAANRFSFSGLPNGSWFIIAVATPVGSREGTAVLRHVETHGGVARVALN